ncbi:MAG TPA: hypothetical protein VMD79_12525, partial [Solirubrobacteraceae bacterium]|nr:hypothetical protein [Solirubrobacteraceae bacterium]
AKKSREEVEKQEAEEKTRLEGEAAAQHGVNRVAAPVCIQQGPFDFNGQTSQFPHAVYSPTATPDK